MEPRPSQTYTQPRRPARPGDAPLASQGWRGATPRPGGRIRRDGRPATPSGDGGPPWLLMVMVAIGLLALLVLICEGGKR